MTTNKTAIQYLAAICASSKINTAIISPGSRNAPLTIAFNRQKNIECISIVDERSAAFFALGIAQQTGTPVALICTSGTAALNYAPAIAEAYYQEVPLLILTADRPAHWIDKGESQVIRQKNIYSNYVDHSFELGDDSESEEIINSNFEIITKAINATRLEKKGPVHINIPLEEPLYNLSEHLDFDLPVIISKSNLANVEFPETKKWEGFSKKMILTGLINPDHELNKILNELSENDDVIVLTETNSNLNGNKFITSIDKVITGINEDELKEFQPELLITIGHNVISKMVKSFLRNNNPEEHWHINPTGQELNTYDCLTSVIKSNAVNFLSTLNVTNNKKSGYSSLWNNKKIDADIKHEKYLSEITYSDIKVFDTVLNNLPENSILQMGNSTIVRYVQLFNQEETLQYFSNRGTSGIDGCTSTAAGAAYAIPSKTVTLITGDISFLYDSNALWNKQLPNNLRIIVINNSGGGIFRFLKGSSEIAEMEEFFETGHNINLGKLAESYGISYEFCSELNSLKSCLDKLFKNKSVSILEIKTPSVYSAESLKKYFNFIR